MRSARFFFGFLAALGSSLSCAPAKSPTLPEPDADLGLGPVVMMTWTTRESDGLIGHNLEPIDGFAINAHRKIISGTPHAVETDQTLHVVMSTGVTAQLGGGYGPLSAEIHGAKATHVAYDVRITGYYEYPVAELKYNAASECCVGGELSPMCGDTWVSRLIRGTGKVQHLQALSGGASVSAAQVVKAEGGSEFKKLSESEFKETYFAYEISPMRAICERLSAEEEMQALAIEAPKNCFVSLIDDEGIHKTLSFTLPSKELCEKLAKKKCDTLAETSIACDARFGTDEKSVALRLEEPSAPQAALATPAIAPPAPSLPPKEIVGAGK